MVKLYSENQDKCYYKKPSNTRFPDTSGTETLWGSNLKYCEHSKVNLTVYSLSPFAFLPVRRKILEGGQASFSLGCFFIKKVAFP